MISRFITLTMVSTGLIAVIGLIAAIIFVRVLTTNIEIPEQVACFLDMKTDCPAVLEEYETRIQQLERRERELHVQVDTLREAELEKGRLEEKIARLSELEAVADEITLFKEAYLGNGMRVVTGTEYSSIVDSQRWTHSWCYVQLPNSSSGLNPRLDLATATATGGVEKHSVSRQARREAGLSGSEVEKAFTLCSWPDASG